ADFDACFGERFENNVSEGWSAGGEAGDGVHVFFVDDDGAANGVEHGARGFEVLGVGMSAAADAGHAAADGARGIGHGAKDGYIPCPTLTQALFDVVGGDGGGDRNDQGFRIKLGRDDLKDVADNLRLHGEEDDVGIADGFAVVDGDR